MSGQSTSSSPSERTCAIRRRAFPGRLKQTARATAWENRPTGSWCRAAAVACRSARVSPCDADVPAAERTRRWPPGARQAARRNSAARVAAQGLPPVRQPESRRFANRRRRSRRAAWRGPGASRRPLVFRSGVLESRRDWPRLAHDPSRDCRWPRALLEALPAGCWALPRGECPNRCFPAQGATADCPPG